MSLEAPKFRSPRSTALKLVIAPAYTMKRRTSAQLHSYSTKAIRSPLRSTLQCTVVQHNRCSTSDQSADLPRDRVHSSRYWIQSLVGPFHPIQQAHNPAPLGHGHFNESIHIRPEYFKYLIYSCGSKIYCLLHVAFAFADE